MPFLHQVMPLIRTVYITSEGAISAATVHRFRGGQLEEVIIDCVFRRFGTSTSDGMTERDITTFHTCSWAGEGGLVTFLAFLPGIKNVFLGKGERETKIVILQRLGLKKHVHGESLTYSLIDNFAKEQAKSFRDGTKGFYVRMSGDIFPSNEDTYGRMIRNLCTGYETGLLPQSMQIFGLPTVHSNPDDGFCVFGECDLCDEMCLTFPLEQVVSLKSAAVKCYFPNKLGNDVNRKIRALFRREGAEEVIKAKQAKLFADLLQQCEVVILEHDRGEFLAINYDMQVMQALRTLKHHGCDPETVVNANTIVINACKRALKGVSLSEDFSGQFRRMKRVFIMKNDFQTLVNDLGFNLNENDFKLVSETDPGLQGTWPLSG